MNMKRLRLRELKNSRSASLGAPGFYATASRRNAAVFMNEPFGEYDSRSELEAERSRILCDGAIGSAVVICPDCQVGALGVAMLAVLVLGLGLGAALSLGEL